MKTTARHRQHAFCHALIMVLLSAVTALGQEGSSYQLTKSVVAGGGGLSENGNLRVEGTVGQSAVGTSNGGSFKLEGGFWPNGTVPGPAVLSVDDVMGTYGGTVTLKATLTATSASVSGKLISFALNGTTVGTATTGVDGTGTLNNVSLIGINAGPYAGAVTAQFAGDSEFGAINSTAQLIVAKGNPLLQVAGGTFVYDGQPHHATGSITGVNNEVLNPLTILYSGSVAVPVNAGSYSVMASFAGNQNYNPITTNLQTVVINKANQTITFSQLLSKNFGDPDFTVSATSSAGLSVSFAATGNCTVTAVSPAIVHITGAGSCTITASQSGNSNYNAAPSVPQTFGTSQTTNSAPDAVNDTLTSVAEDSGMRTIAIASLLSNDTRGSGGAGDETGQMLTFSLVGGSGVGGAVTSDATNVYFAPAADFNGTASFQYLVTDNGTTNGAPDPKSDTATVSFTVTEVNDTPTANNDPLATVAENSGERVIQFSTLLSNDSRGPANESGQTLTVKTVSNPVGGTVSIVGGTVRFAPAAHHTGLTTFQYTVEDNGTTNGTADPKTSAPATAHFNITVNSLGGVIRFSATNYSVGEGAGVRVITVERTGDASRSATVDYASSDHSSPADFIPCTSPGAGLASSRCDFTTATATLRFAAGETSKTFNVLISQDNSVEGPETLNLTLSNPTGGAELGVPSTAVMEITDDATEPATNPIDTSSEFVRAQYHDVLNREPDPPGLAFWTDNIEKCNDPARRPAGQSVAQCIDKQRESTAIAFFMSPEFQMTGGFVYRLYKGSLTGSPNFDAGPAGSPGSSPGRFPTFLEFMHDLAQVSEGIVVINQIDGAVVEVNRNRLAAEFVERPEFVAKYGGLNDTLYVQELFNTTGINQEQFNSGAGSSVGPNSMAAEKQALVDGLANGTETRASVLRKVVDGTVVISEANVQFTTTYGRAFYEQEYRRVFVFMEYVGYLRRNADSAGYIHWLGKLNQFNGDPFQAEMVRSFILSPEYRSRFGQP